MTAPDIIDRLKLLARGDNLDLADIVCADAVAEIERLRASHNRSSERTDDAARAERFAAQLVQLQKGIQDYLDGNYGRAQHFKSKHDKCPHGLFGWEACENCIDEHFSRLLAVVSSPVEGK